MSQGWLRQAVPPLALPSSLSDDVSDVDGVDCNIFLCFLTLHPENKHLRDWSLGNVPQLLGLAVSVLFCEVF